VQRLWADSIFPNPSDARVYASLDSLARGPLIAVSEGNTTIWARVETPHLERGLSTRLWEAIAAWTGRIANTLEANSATPQKYELVFRFDDTNEQLNRHAARPPEHPRSLIQVEVNAKSSATLYIAAGFIHAFCEPSNAAERALVEAALLAVQILGGWRASGFVADTLALVVPNDTARRFHLTRDHEFIDVISAKLPSMALVVDEIDRASLRIGLGWSVYDGDDIVEGEASCCELLNRIVSASADRSLAILREWNRAEVVEHLVTSLLVSQSKTMHWKRTSSAVLGLHGVDSRTTDTVVQQLSILNGAQVMGRVMIEMALCACPLRQGRSPANLEIEALLAHIELQFHLGNMSDAIHYGALEPRFRISPLGDILAQDTFGEEVVDPMLNGEMGDQYVRSAGDYPRYYSKPGPFSPATQLFSTEFLTAWDAEMGFTIDEGRGFIELLENEAIEREVPVMKMSLSLLIEMLSRETDSHKATRFVKRFSLAPRDDWKTPPNGFKAKEISPWRFGRRLSVVTRPLLQLDTTDDPLFLVAPTLVRAGFFFILRGSHSGSLRQEFFQAPEMRDAWWGKAREGHTFNAAIASRLQRHGWFAQENVLLSALLQQKLDRDYGDVDVLAWRSGCDQVFVIECKDLSFRRTYSEIAAQLSDYRGKMKKGKPDKLRKHLNRVEQLQKNLSVVSRLTGIPSPKIESCLITSGRVPMQFTKSPALDGSFVGDVDWFLSKFGDPRAADPAALP
jgi:hypothetical protein